MVFPMLSLPCAHLSTSQIWPNSLGPPKAPENFLGIQTLRANNGGIKEGGLGFVFGDLESGGGGESYSKNKFPLTLLQGQGKGQAG